MPKAPTSAPQAVTELVEHFERNLDQYRSPQYKEAEVRREFIDPFFEALGWDVQNKRKYAEAYKDVVHEPSLDEEGTPSRAPDYSFQPAGHIKFFLEAKKPSVNLDENHSPALQLRRYGWTQQLPISILTNFAEFAVYDCRMEPGPADGASTARVLYLTFDEYAAQWDELVGLFSPDAVFKGSFDRFAETRKRKGVAPFDQRFLDDMEAWRKRLAENLALRNHGLSQPELNYAVQQTIDRILFLRICEARGIEPLERLRGVAEHPNIYPNLVNHFRLADNEYNSGLFHFHRERGRLQPDELTPNLKLDDEVLQVVIGQLYWPARPYAFEVVPADILGQVYERFLGKVIRLTAGHHAKVEEKPEVKKAGGVYYTPTYIVDYIVKNTVGKLLEGKTPKQASKLRILDPACGSGSFLLGAYDFLLKWYLHAYIEEGPEKHKDRLYPAGGSWKLTIGGKKKILLDNIYGVDIDSQAVEVTKLSLLLKVLEGESEQTAKPRLIREPALPDLDRNIKCGNSLIGPDFYKDRGGVDDGARRRINAFDWNAEFPGIMSEGGFDAVIGNPPYLRIQIMKEWAPLEVDFYKHHYESAKKGNYDIYVVFIERAFALLNATGSLGFIVPNKFFNAEYGEPLRKMISTVRCLSHVVHFGAEQVFSESTTYTCLVFLDKHDCAAANVVRVGDLRDWRINKRGEHGMVPATAITASPWNFTVGRDAALVDKLAKEAPSLGSVAEVFVGLQTSADDVYILDLVKEGTKHLHLHSKSLGKKCRLEKGIVFPLISGTDVRRYQDLPSRQYIVFPYAPENGAMRLVDFATLAKRFPNAAAYLSANRQRLEGRERGKAKGPRWFAYLYAKNLDRQATVKLCIPRLVDHLYATIDLSANHFLDNVDVCGVAWRPAHTQIRLEYLLALLNSRLLRWYFPHVSASFRGGWLSANRQFLSQLPIKMPDLAKAEQAAVHESLVGLAKHMLDLHRNLERLRTDHERNTLGRQLDATDRQIDQLVYQLYGLTEDEIALVESAQPANPH